MEGASPNKTPIIAQKLRSISQQENKFGAEIEGNVGNCVADFKIISELGRGSYGVVNKVISNVDNRIYVMKKINIKHVKQKHQKEALKEAQILRKVRHPNIIKYYTSFVEDEHLYIIMEYAEGGDLQMVITSYRKSFLIKFISLSNLAYQDAPRKKTAFQRERNMDLCLGIVSGC